MFVRVNGVRLYVDIDGAGLVPKGPVMREKPTLILVHGGPGADHSIFKPAFSQLGDLCQIVYFDQRGNGRSEDGDPADWTLAQWGDDLHALCSALGIDRPVVYGASFGGLVAQSYATRHPDHPRALILASTTPRTDFEAIFAAFETLGGPQAGAIARAYWSDPTPERRQAYFDTCLPLYALAGFDPDMMARMIVKSPVAMQFNGPANEQGRFDFTADLARVTCPALILGGDRDPIMPPVCSDRLAAALPQAEHVRISPAAHMLERDQPAEFFKHLRHFIKDLDRDL